MALPSELEKRFYLTKDFRYRNVIPLYEYLGSTHTNLLTFSTHICIYRNILETLVYTANIVVQETRFNVSSVGPSSKRNMKTCLNHFLSDARPREAYSRNYVVRLRFLYYRQYNEYTSVKFYILICI